MFIHWAEIRQKTATTAHGGFAEDEDEDENGDEEDEEVTRDIAYHMNLIDSYDFRSLSGTAFPNLRRDISSVLDWGTLKRKNQIKDVCKAIGKRTRETLGQLDNITKSRKRRRE